jgi:predicted amidophosphoribosyltransferase
MSGAQPRREWLSALADLVLPAICLGCGRDGSGQFCGACRRAMTALVPRLAMPDPIPHGLPACVALGAYDGPLRSLLLAYKERGAYLLGRPLGAALAAAVAAAVGEPGRPVALVGVPSTPSAVRERYGDHVARLGRRAAATMRSTGWPAIFVPAPVRALPKADSSHLNASARAAAADTGFRVRPDRVRRLAVASRAGVAVVVIDDIITTGSTLASVSRLLERSGVPVDAAATLAATQRWAGWRRSRSMSDN